MLYPPNNVVDDASSWLSFLKHNNVHHPGDLLLKVIRKSILDVMGFFAL